MTLNTGKFIISFICLITFLNSCSHVSSKRDLAFYKLSPEEIGLLQEGDILLRRGYGLVSNLIVKTLAEDIPVSHVGLLTKHPHNGQFMVVHSVSQSVSDTDGVQWQDLNAFIRDSQPNSLIVMRYKHLEQISDATGRISDQAHYYLKKKVKFDYSFDFNNPERFFCSEFIGRVFYDVFSDRIFNDEFLNTGSELDKLKFSVFFDAKRFEEVLSHQ